jgi:PleD family two-component response regulator
MRVFIIDDYLDFALPLKDNFVQKGYTAEYCIDSLNAVKNAIKFKPDWVVIDVRMPYKTGVELFMELREKAGFEFSAVFYSLYLSDPAVMAVLTELSVRDEAKIEKTIDLDRDVSEKLIPALEAGYLKGGKKNV